VLNSVKGSEQVKQLAADYVSALTIRIQTQSGCSGSGQRHSTSDCTRPTVKLRRAVANQPQDARVWSALM
jgi:hypothetical protein